MNNTKLRGSNMNLIAACAGWMRDSGLFDPQYIRLMESSVGLTNYNF